MEKETSKNLYKNDSEIQNICLNNGISEASLVYKIDSITKLEMSHFNITNINRKFSVFRNLKSLTIVAQDISFMSENSLIDCNCLEKLWICETKISEINGLPCNLTHLYLYSNQIKRIAGIEKCKDLNTLWLNDNRNFKYSNLRNK